MTSCQQAEFRFTLDTPDRDVVFVLSAADDLKERRAELLSATLRAMKSLPAAVKCSAFFLGNSRRYSVRELETRGRLLLDENQSRASLIGPVMRELHRQDATGRIVIVGANRVFDLADWHDAAAPIAYLTSARLGQSRSVSDPQALAEILCDPIQRVAISLCNLAPTEWDNAGYTIMRSDKRLVLGGENLPTFDVCVRGMQLGDRCPTAQVVHASGRVVECRLSGESSATWEMPSVELSDCEARVFRALVRGSCFTCPICAQKHAPATFRCDNEVSPRFRFRGRPLFASLEGLGQKGLLVGCDEGAQVRCEYAGQSLVDADRRGVFFALDQRRLYWVAFGDEGVDWKSAARIPRNVSQLRDHHDVFIYH